VSRLPLALVLAAALWTTSAAPAAVGVYDSNPQHLWNRLHETLFVRTGPYGREYGRDRIEPLLWRGSKHLLEDPSHGQLLAVLAEFNRDGDRLIADPLRRALLQRDLWMVFTWLGHSHDDFYGFGGNKADWRARQDALRQPLATAIARLALTPRQIQELPDTYAAAVASRAFASRFDPQHPDANYLPADLFVRDSPWVSLGRGHDLIAPNHVTGDNPFTTSAFLIFITLPGGRAATRGYLAKLASFKGPMFVATRTSKAEYPNFNPAIPQIPAGTQVALVRRALLVSSTGEVLPSPLTESVQVRFYREVPTVALDDMVRATLIDDRVRAQQARYEYFLSRRRLFAGQAGGLYSSADADDDILTGFATHGVDPFEPRDGQPPSIRSHVPRRFPVTEICISCHVLQGVYSVNSLMPNFGNAMTPQHPAVVETPVSDVLAAGASWKRGRDDWALLKALMRNGDRPR